MLFLTKGRKPETRVYTPGKFGLAHPRPHETTPEKNIQDFLKPLKITS